MKNAIIAAVVAALVSSGGTYAAVKINGQAITKHSIPKNRLTARAINDLHGSQGPVGPAGPAGPRGTAGPRGLTTAVNPSTIDVQTNTQSIGGWPWTQQSACPAGEIPIAGGYTIDGAPAYVTANGIYTNTDTGETGWQVTLSGPATSQSPLDLTVNVSCEPSA